MKLRLLISLGCGLLLSLSNVGKGQGGNPVAPQASASRIAAKPGDPERNGGFSDPDPMANNFAANLQGELDLTPEQTGKVELIFSQESREIQLQGGVRSPDVVVPSQLRARAQVRGLLSAEQRRKYNLIPWYFGGGLFGLSPGEQLDQLDGLVHLTPDQKQAALEVYADGTERLMEIRQPKPTEESRTISLGVRRDIRLLLTPDQQKLWELTSKTQGGGGFNNSVAYQLKHLDEIVHLTFQQKPVALQILEDGSVLATQAPGSDDYIPMPEIRRETLLRIYALLTPEQQKAYDAALARHREREAKAAINP